MPNTKTWTNQSLANALVEELAAQQGISPQDLQNLILGPTWEVGRPSAHCFTPEDIERYYLDGCFDAAQEDHLKGCSNCARLIRATLPGGSRLDEFRRYVKETLGQPIR